MKNGNFFIRRNPNNINNSRIRTETSSSTVYRFPENAVADTIVITPGLDVPSPGPHPSGLSS